LPLDRLVLLRLSYFDFFGRPHDDGRMIVMDAASPRVLNLFKKLYNIKFPIEKIHLTSEYSGDDNISMAANNTSSYNCREVTGGGLPSSHSYGIAIDINPTVNPYVSPIDKKKGTMEVLPYQGTEFMGRGIRLENTDDEK